MLIQIKLPDFSIVMGVIRNTNAPIFEQDFIVQIHQQQISVKYKSIDDLFMSGNTFTIRK